MKNQRTLSQRVLPVALLLLVQASFGEVKVKPCRNNYTPEQQIQMGQKAAQQVYKQMPVLPDSNAVTKYVQRLGKKLTAYAPGYQWPYNFHVANVAEINAFALPGGTVFVNLGTIQAADTEAQLAGVMAHEISHVVLQHSVCNASKEQKVGILAGIGQIAAGVLVGGAAGQLAAQGIGMTAGLGFLKMSRGAEREADLLGVKILYDAGYDPRAMAQFFETLQAKYGEGDAQFLSDHPNPGNRTEYVEKETDSLPPRTNYVKTTPEFAAIKKLVATMHPYTSKQVSSGVWKNQNPNQTYQVKADLDTSGSWRTVLSDGFSMAAPANWQAYKGQDGGSTLAPTGGIVQQADGTPAVVYGVVAGVYRPQRQHMALNLALAALVADVQHDNPGLAAGPQTDVTGNGVSGRGVECRNPDANNGAGERDWVVAFPQPDGNVRYLVFVAPMKDFDAFRPAFERMAQSVTIP
jgi:hypothetical protein